MTQLNILLVLLLAAGPIGLQAQPAADGPAPDRDTLIATNPQLAHEAVEYHRRLTAPLMDFRKTHYDYVQTITRLRRAKAVERKRQELLKILQSNRDLFKTYDSFHGDTTLKSDLIRYLDLVYIVLKEDFDKILDMEDITAQSYDQAEAHQLALDLACDKLKASFDVLKKAETEFFKKYHISARDEKDELSLKIEKANKALDYYNAIARIFAKANRENSYASIAVSNKDIAGLEQHVMTLVSFSEDGLGQLKQKNGYEGDNDLLSAAITSLEFYRHEGQVTYPANVDFSIKTDNFEKTQKRFNAIKESDRKKEDVDKYNNEVHLYNKAAKEINGTNHTAYKTHEKLIKLWNKQVEKFFKKHS